MIKLSKVGGLDLLFFVLLTFSAPAFSQHTLQVEVTGIKNDTGVIMLQLLNSREEVLVREKGIIIRGVSEISIKEVPSGKYGIRYFQDENGNGVLDKNKLGIPKEGYGFSNNAYSLFGPKPFNEWLFEITDDKELVLKIKY
jgi:uncharacterized protein (DUF2141 family)